MAKVKVKTDTEIEWNGKVKTLKAGEKVPADGQH
jgi:hypothetical protein